MARDGNLPATLVMHFTYSSAVVPAVVMGIILVHLPVPFASFCHVQALFVSMICMLIGEPGRFKRRACRSSCLRGWCCQQGAMKFLP